MPRSFSTSKPRSRPLRWLVRVGAVALAGAATALAITAASAAPNAKPPQPSPTPSAPVMLTVTLASLNFAPQVVDTTSADKSVTITNPSSQSQKVQPLTFIANDFREVANSCPTGAQAYLLAPGASCTATFNFAPISTGNLSVTVNVTLTPFGLPGQTITLTGTGTTASGTATLTNNDGNEDCATSLLTQVSVNLPDGTQLWITYDNYPVGTITLNGGSGGMTPFGFPNTAYGLDQVRVYTSFPSSTSTPILQGTAFTIQSS